MDTSQPQLSQSFWDPLGEVITKQSYVAEGLKISNKLNEYKAHPQHLREKRLLYISIAFVVAAVAFYIAFETKVYNIAIFLFIIGCVPLGNFLRSLHVLKQDSILLLLAEKNYWVYNPETDTRRLASLFAQFPSLFDIGHSHDLSNQLWGKIGTNNPDFWFCRFVYVTGSGKSRTTHYNSIFSVHLPKTTPVNFTLRKNYLISLGSVMRTESEEFNKKFDIICDRKDSLAQTQILSILSPSVQVRLNLFSGLHPMLSAIHFIGQQVFFVFRGEMFVPKYTNFFNNVEIDERDNTAFMKSITDILDIPSEIIKFID